MSHVTRTLLSRSKVKVARPLWLVVLAGQHGHTVMVTFPYAYTMTYIVPTLAGLGGGISWRPPAYSLLMTSSFQCFDTVSWKGIWPAEYLAAATPKVLL